MRLASYVPGELIPLPLSGSIPELPHVEKVVELIVRDGSERQARAGSLMLKRASLQAAGSALPAFGGSGRWPPGGTRPEPKRVSQPEAIEAQDALQVREQHLDLLPFTARRHVDFGLGDVARNVSGLFVD